MKKPSLNIRKRIHTLRQSRIGPIPDARLFWVTITSISILVILFLFVKNYLPYLPEFIPLFYTLPWGELQLAQREYIWTLVATGFLITTISIILTICEYKKGHFFLARLYSYSTVIVNSLLFFYTYRIISIISLEPVDIPQVVKLIFFPLMLAFMTTYLITPYVMKFAKKHGYMDDPLIHKHPGMLLTKPTPRAGGLAFYLGVLIPALLILPIHESQKMIGIFAGALILVLVGLRDDKVDMSPYTRFFLQGLAILITVMSGIILIYVPNPFGDAIILDQFKYVIEFMGEHKIYYFSVIAACIWMWWTINFMSFANGSDGVYAGLVSVTALVITIIIFQSLSEDPMMAPFVKLSALIVGAGLGMAIFTWPPNKILWGFSAQSAALMIAALSILGSTKVAVTLLILMIPFLDGGFAIVRRISRRQFPFWGDREHLHHKMLDDWGWTKNKVATFYWSTTVIFASIGILTSGKTRALSLLTVALIVVAIIALFNIGKVINGKFSKGISNSQSKQP